MPPVAPPTSQSRRPQLAALALSAFVVACTAPPERFADPQAAAWDQVPVTPIADAATTVDVPGAPDFLEVASAGAAWVMNPATASVQLVTEEGVVDEVTGVSPIGAMCQAFGSLWVASRERGTPGELVRIDSARRQVLARIPAGMLGYESTLAASADHLWVLTHRRGELTVVDPATDAVDGVVRVAPNSFGLAAGFGSIWVTSMGPAPEEGADFGPGLLQRVDPETREVVATIELGPMPLFLATGEGMVWVVNQGDGTVSVVDPTTDAVVRTIPLGIAGPGGDIAVGGGSVWVRASETLLTRVDPWTGAVLARYGPQAGSGGVRAAHGVVWLSAHDTGEVWRLPAPRQD